MRWSESDRRAVLPLPLMLLYDCIYKKFLTNALLALFIQIKIL
jgi:hypothetical protein